MDFFVVAYHYVFVVGVEPRDFRFFVPVVAVAAGVVDVPFDVPVVLDSVVSPGSV